MVEVFGAHFVSDERQLFASANVDVGGSCHASFHTAAAPYFLAVQFNDEFYDAVARFIVNATGYGKAACVFGELVDMLRRCVSANAAQIKLTVNVQWIVVDRLADMSGSLTLRLVQ